MSIPHYNIAECRALGRTRRWISRSTSPSGRDTDEADALLTTPLDNMIAGLRPEHPDVGLIREALAECQRNAAPCVPQGADR